MINNRYMQTLEYTNIRQIKTQKARGVKALVNGYNVGLGVRGISHGFIWPQNRALLMDEGLGLNYFHTPLHGWFARPCPMVPRHGFVESRPVKEVAEAEEVFRETLAVEPKAEMLIMPKLSGVFSGIATNAGVTWGMGNDAVTSGGQGQTFLIPTPTTDVKTWLYHTGSNITAYVNIKGTAYIELVENNNEVNAVQYRDGPEQPTTSEYIPKKMTVKHVLTAEGDLLSWEEEILNAKPGSVVWLQDLPLSSHYAVHAIAAGIPVVCKQPKTGEVLHPSVFRVDELTKADLLSLRDKSKAWFERGTNRNKDNLSNYILDASLEVHHRGALGLCVASVHAMGSWDNSDHLLNLRAFAFPNLIRYINAACLGELRHWKQSGPGRAGYRGPKRKTKLSNTSWSANNLYRGQVHAISFCEPSLRRLITQLAHAEEDFLTKGWESRHSQKAIEEARRNRVPLLDEYAYGGPKWADVARAGHKAALALEAFYFDPNKETYKALILSINTAIHTAHNGGSVLSKWVGDAELAQIAKAPGWGLMSAVSANVTLGLITPEKGQF